MRALIRLVVPELERCALNLADSAGMRNRRTLRLTRYSRGDRALPTDDLALHHPRPSLATRRSRDAVDRAAAPRRRVPPRRLHPRGRADRRGDTARPMG